MLGILLGLKKGHSFSPELHAGVFQAKIYVIKADVMENIEKNYTCRNIQTLSNS